MLLDCFSKSIRILAYSKYYSSTSFLSEFLVSISIYWSIFFKFIAKSLDLSVVFEESWCFIDSKLNPRFFILFSYCSSSNYFANIERLSLGSSSLLLNFCSRRPRLYIGSYSYSFSSFFFSSMTYIYFWRRSIFWSASFDCSIM